MKSPTRKFWSDANGTIRNKSDRITLLGEQWFGRVTMVRSGSDRIQKDLVGWYYKVDSVWSDDKCPIRIFCSDYTTVKN